MREENGQIPDERSLELRASDVVEPAAPPTVNPLLELHMLLKGRYAIAITLAAVLGIIGAAAGFGLGSKSYIASGVVQFTPQLPTVMYQDPEKQVLPMFDQYIDTQVSIIGGQRIIDMAMHSDAWVKAGQGTSQSEYTDFTKNLEVARVGKGQLVRVTFKDKRPEVAKAAVKGVIDAYQQVYKELDTESGEKRSEALQQFRGKLEADREALRQNISAIATAHGTSDLDKEYELKFNEVADQEKLLNQLEMQSALWQSTNAAGVAQGLSPSLTTAANNPTLIGLTNELLLAKRRVSQLKAEGLGERSREMVLAKAEVEFAQSQIDEIQNAKVATPQEGHPSGATQPASSQLKEQVARVRALYEKARKELLDLGKEKVRMDDLRSQASIVEGQLNEVKKRIEQLDVESAITGRLQVPPLGERPEEGKDSRLMFAPAGLAGGMVLGIGIVALTGLLDRRFRSPADAHHHINHVPLLGILPNLPEDVSDPEQAALTAHFVHQIRTLLQIWHGGRDNQVFAVTSPIAGTGKTSLTLAVGVSFAAAESRTLLIDCDLIGGGLTNRANAIVRRKIGRILQNDGILSEAQLGQALRLANASHRRLGEILVELGYLKEAELANALVRQQKASVGLLEALNGESLKDCVAETGIANLWVLPLGSAMGQHVTKLTPHSVRKLLGVCRQHFDTILIDTGPTPGSLEASVVAAEADGVILCVSRGEHRPLAERCINHLTSIGARMVGIVFNRARIEDMVVYGTTIRRSVPAGRQLSVPVPMQEAERYGPVAQAVAGSGGENGVGGNGTAQTPDTAQSNGAHDNGNHSGNGSAHS